MISNKCIAVANYLVKKTLDYNKGKKYYSEKIFMTCKRLQKLLYFCDIEYMKRNEGEPLFEDAFNAWPTGPVIPRIYDFFVMYQNGMMYPVNTDQEVKLSDSTQAVLDFIFERTIETDTIDLVEASRVANGPWAKVYDSDDEFHHQVISKAQMFKFYNRKTLS